MILLLQSKGEGREKANAPWPRFPDPGRLELFGELFRRGDAEKNQVGQNLRAQRKRRQWMLSHEAAMRQMKRGGTTWESFFDAETRRRGEKRGEEPSRSKPESAEEAETMDAVARGRHAANEARRDHVGELFRRGDGCCRDEAGHAPNETASNCPPPSFLHDSPLPQRSQVLTLFSPSSSPRFSPRLRDSASKRNLPARTGSSGSGSDGYRFRAGALARVSTEMGVPRKPKRRRSWLTR